MKASELIERLSLLNPDAEIHMHYQFATCNYICQPIKDLTTLWVNGTVADLDGVQFPAPHDEDLVRPGSRVIVTLT